MLQKRISEIIRNLKRVRQEDGLSISEIVNLCEKNGESVSETTVKKVFADGSEAFGFNYESTLKPLINALLKAHEETAETDMMISVAEFKAAKIKDLEAQMARMEESYKRRIEFLKQQIDIKDSRVLFICVLVAFHLTVSLGEQSTVAGVFWHKLNQFFHLGNSHVVFALLIVNLNPLKVNIFVFAYLLLQNVEFFNHFVVVADAD